ncbi:hypothetical protein MLC35_00685 [Sulfurimonas sp. NW7]|uniref:hypothetical protein n=1 Tax=Sulfurimonas sp. NW7 TaxID=2922727 RepID=UPI003DA7EDF0
MSQKNRPKHIIFIPPDGAFKKQDFSIQRVVKWLHANDTFAVKTTLLYIGSDISGVESDLFDEIIVARDKQEIITILRNLEYDVVFHRAWMTCYEFAAELTKEFSKVVVNIKDWNFASKEVYEFLYPDYKDHEAIEYIFKNAYKILSHFTAEQSKIWAKEYKTSQEKFVFFPEYCNESSFHSKQISQSEVVHLVYAGNIQPTARPEEYFPGKAHLRSLKKITGQAVKIDFVLPENVYDNFFQNKDLYQDFIFESFVNDNFNIVKGKALNSSVLNKYDYGFFELEATGVNNMLYKYAITSKFAFYLEAGLPILVNSKFVSMSNLVQKYQLGIVFSNNNLDEIDTILDKAKSEYSNYLDNIKKFRKEFVYKNKYLSEIIDV